MDFPAGCNSGNFITMHKLLLRIWVVLFLGTFFFIAGCSDPASPPKNDGKNDPDDQTGFHITAITKDTFYTGEEAWIEVQEMGDTLENLTLFVHTVPAKLLNIVGNKLFFEVPQNATTARIRLYKHDTLQAKGDFFLNILPHGIHFDFAVHSFLPEKGYEGDIIRITGNDFPFRKREIEVSVNGVPFEIDTFDQQQILARVTPNVQSGPLLVKLRGTEFNAGTFTRLNEGGKLLGSTYFFESTITALFIDAALETTGIVDSGREGTKGSSFGMWVQTKTNYNITRTDSIRVAIDEENQSDRKRMILSLKESADKNTVSGRIVLEQWINQGSVDAIHERTVLEVRDIRWRHNGGDYELYADGPEIKSKIPVMEFEQQIGSVSSVLTDYRGGDISSRFSLRLR